MKDNIYQLIYLYVGISSVMMLFIMHRGQVYYRAPMADIAIKNETDCGNASEVVPSEICNSMGDSGTDSSSFENKTKISDQWPCKLRLRMPNYGCTIPASNFDVTEKRLIEAWHLPPKTRLSPIMREMARCQLAADEMASKGIEFDSSECVCVESWPIKLSSIAFFGMMFFLFAIIFGFPINTTKHCTARAHWKVILTTHIPLIIWSVAETTIHDYLYGKTDIGLWYTIYGNMYPTNYFRKSMEWMAIRLIIQINYYVCFGAMVLAWLETVCFYGIQIADLYAITTKKTKPKPMVV